MFDHIKFGASDYAASKAFFMQALAPLNVRVLSEGEPAYGVAMAGDGPASLCLYQASGPVSAMHLAFGAPTRQAARDFHRAALAAGGRNHGEPGLRPRYHPSYYAAFVIGPDGHNVEAVCHAATE